MKKIVTLLLSMILVISTLTACGSKSESVETTPEVTTETTIETTEPEMTDAASAKTGLAVITSIEKSASVGEKDGLAQVDSTVVAVLVGEDGTILACNIDAAQTKVNFSAEGKILTALDSMIKSKQEMKTEYGLSASSALGKEWNEQADALAAYVVGKTVDEVKGIALTDTTAPADADLTATVTIKIGGYIAAIEKAVANAVDLGAKSTDKLGLAISTDIAGSKDATAEEAGLAQAYSMYSVVTTDADGKITSCLVDASQGKVNFDATGMLTSDLTVAPQTKQELGEAYGMKSASAIGKEWNEEADAFAAYVMGKTVAEVTGIAVDDAGLAADADLVSSVTVHVGPFIEVVAKAVGNVK